MRFVASEYVIDCSALVDAVIGNDTTADDIRAQATGSRLHAPELLSAEFGHVLRRKVAAGDVSPHIGHGYLRAVATGLVHRYPHGALVDVAWKLRDHVSFYDALYVALAARLDLPLLTADRKLAATHTLPCQVTTTP